MNRLLGSSVDPNKISLTIKSVVKGLITLAAVLGLNQITGDVQAIGDNLVELVGVGMMAYNSIEAIYGAGRKIFMYFKTKKGE